MLSVMTLSKDAVEWAVDFVAQHSDGDLFPRVTEIAAILAQKAKFSGLIAGKQLGDFAPGPHRRFIVPKDEISYRQATQLDPQDTIILSAIVYQYGRLIEARRRPTSEVFSYRFAPTVEDGLYDKYVSWNEFWETVEQRAQDAGAVLYCDISDFYNQIYHHTVENQLAESGLPNQVTKWVIALLASTTGGVSRGVPIGPHAAHLVAEASLIPVDNSMADTGLEFARYADDIVVFAESKSEARRALGKLARILDRQQRLILQRHKTRFFSPEDFGKYCQKMIEDRPINEDEEELLEIVEKYSGGSPYKSISYNQIDADDWNALSDDSITRIIEEYIQADEVDYIRLRWFYRRLAQIGHPGAVDVTLDNLEFLTPCFASICAYIASLQEVEASRWRKIGTRLLKLLDLEEVRESEYFRLSILSLFSRNPEINHFKRLQRLYQSSDSFAKREVLLAAKTSGAVDWLREHKEDFDAMDQWQKRAFLYCTHDFPADERKFFIRRHQFERPFEATLASWAQAGV